MSKAVRLRSNIEYKVLLLEGNPQFENFYKEELIQFCKTARNILLEQRQENQQLKNDNAVMKAGLIQIRDEKLDLYKSVIDEILKCTKEHYVIDNPIKFKNDIQDIIYRANIKEDSDE